MIGQLVLLLSGMGGRNDCIDNHRRLPHVYSWSFLARVNSIKRCIVEFATGLGRCHRTIRHSELARIVVPRFSSLMSPATWLHFVCAFDRPHDKIMNSASAQGYNPPSQDVPVAGPPSRNIDGLPSRNSEALCVI